LPWASLNSLFFLLVGQVIACQENENEMLLARQKNLLAGQPNGTSFQALNRCA